jgi:hypothetical protein
MLLWRFAQTKRAARLIKRRLFGQNVGRQAFPCRLLALYVCVCVYVCMCVCVCMCVYVIERERKQERDGNTHTVREREIKGECDSKH